MDRRLFVKGATLAALTTRASVGAAQETLAPLQDSHIADPINPAGIKVAGIRMILVRDGKYKVWTKKIGDGRVKVLLLHGGPGATHEYLEAMESFLPQAGFEIYYYDQLGCGNSDRPDDKNLWSLERYTTEVEEVRRGLGLSNFVLFGHSWGGILAIEYALTYQQNLRALVISNMTAGIKSYLRRTSSLKVQMLTPERLDELNQLEAAADYDSPRYLAIMNDDLYPQMICRTKPWPEPATRAFNHINSIIYEQMQGKSEFQVTGNLKDWERWDRLHELRVKTLTIGARYDEMDPDDMKKISTMVQHGSYAYCPNGSHCCFWDDQAVYFRQLIAFLRNV